MLTQAQRQYICQVHRLDLAADIFQKHVTEVTPQERSVAKFVQMAVGHGMEEEKIIQAVSKMPKNKK